MPEAKAFLRITNLSTTIRLTAVSTLLGAALLGAVAQTRSTPQAHKGSAETSLVGIALYDTGTKVINRFGSPDEVQALSLGGSGGGGSSGEGRGGPGGADTGKSSGAAKASIDVIGDPFEPRSNFWQNTSSNELQLNPNAPGGTGGPGPGGADPGSGGGGAGGSTQGSSSLVTYTRWVYNRNSSRYAFVLDKYNHVVQIEAIGYWNKNVRTKRGVSFGSSFGSLIKKYNAPDGYEINGETMVVRFLNRDRVAFKLQKVDPKKPAVVTGIVVAAGK